MGTKRRILIAGLPVIVLGALVWFLFFLHGPPEPVYQGRPLRAWLEDYFHANAASYSDKIIFGERRSPDQPEASARAELAIHQMGTNVLPALLRMTGKRRWVLKEKLARFIQRFSRTPVKASVPDHLLGVMGFRVLGAAARPAVPALIKLLDDRDITVRTAAAEALGCIGPEAQDAVPALILRTRQTNLNIVQWSATSALGEIHSRSELTLPALIQNLASTNSLPGSPGTCGYSVVALGEFGAEAKPAVPAILPFLNDPNPIISKGAAIALKKIDPEAAAKAGVK